MGKSGIEPPNPAAYRGGVQRAATGAE